MTEQHSMIVAMAKAMWADTARDFPDNGPFEDSPDWVRDLWFRKARAALTALRDLSPDAVEVGHFAASLFSHNQVMCRMDGEPVQDRDEQLPEVWAEIIDYILAPSGDGSADPQTAGQTTTATTKGER